MPAKKDITPWEKRNRRLKHKYGITADRYEDILDFQHGCCAICQKPPKTRRLSVDHNHRTRRVRGLLCYRCNYGLGFFDNPALLRRAADYLEEPTWVTSKRPVSPPIGNET